MWEFAIVFIIFVVVMLDWFEMRGKLRRAETEEEIRKAIMPFVLMLLLFVIAVIGLFF
ncbi:hypothetical protein ACFOZ1_08855 [Gracilibacillus marinus]|uniref:Uncharacterized protein n=1 Tax=Gracilibacillus marinus TaxID=630535 RepID=A0ABV8VW17_9BACI